MNDSVALESQIQEEVERLRAKSSNTRDLYKEVCALLFFRYGITPTTNKLYQFVRKGSMSIPTEVLNNFWKDLREKSRVRISRPDLPKDLNDLAGEAITIIWTKAQLAAEESLIAYRSEVEADILKLNAERDALEKSRVDFILQLQCAEKELFNQSLKIKDLEELLINSDTQKDILEEQLDHSKAKQKSLETELEKMQALIDDIKARTHSEISKVLMEINQEKSAAAKLDAELASIRIAYEKLYDITKVEANLLNTQIGDLREKVGALNGRLQIADTINEKLNTEIMMKDEKLKDFTAKLATLDRPSTKWQSRIQQKNIKRFTPSNKS